MRLNGEERTVAVKTRRDVSTMRVYMCIYICIYPLALYIAQENIAENERSSGDKWPSRGEEQTKGKMTGE